MLKSSKIVWQWNKTNSSLKLVQMSRNRFNNRIVILDQLNYIQDSFTCQVFHFLQHKLQTEISNCLDYKHIKGNEM